MKKIVLVVGARPNFMKAFPVYQALKNDFELKLIHTGQHFDAKMSDVFFNQLGFPVPDIHFELESKSRAGKYDTKLYIDNQEYLRDKNQVINELMNEDFKNLGQLGEIRDKLEKEFEKIKPDMIIVFGDVTSTLAAGLAGKKLSIEVAHVESGLRSGDLTMPEEVNRILTDYLTTYYFVTEPDGVTNLKNEGIETNVFLVGNTMIDCLYMFKDKALETKYHEKIGLVTKEYVLVTLHRPSNVDDLVRLKEIFDELFELAKNEKIVYPVHPRTKTNLDKICYLEKINSYPNIILKEPLGYLEFTCLESNAKYVITDSGGIQEETTALDVPCFTLRPNTERPITLIDNGGTNQLIGKMNEIILKKCVNSIELWDGKSSKKIYNKLSHSKIRKIAIGYAHSGKNIGGVRKYIENIEKLSKCKITLYPSYENDALWKENYDMKIRNDYLNNEIKKKQQEIIDNHDVFHSNVDPTWIKLCEEAQKQGKLWIHTYHSFYKPEDELDGKLKKWQKEINDVQFNIGSKANFKICVGEWLIDECKKKKIDAQYIPNFVNIENLNNSKKNMFKAKYKLNNYILFVGNDSKNKNCLEFIKVAKILSQYNFVLIGTGLFHDEIEKTYNIVLDKNIYALGPLEHSKCLEAINDCDILVMNSFTEGLPTVLIETMYFEKPCIIPDGPDWSKYLLNNQNIGYKYPIGNIEKLSEKICEIMKNYKKLTNAKKHVENTFSSDSIINKLDNLYNTK